MVLDLRNAIREITQEKGISEELIVSTIEKALTKAYEKYYGTIENLEIRQDEDQVMTIMSRKEVVSEVEDDLFEISLDEAKEIDEAAEPGDEMLVPCNPEEFGRIAIHSAKQIIFQNLKEIQKNSIYSEYKAKEGELIIGYIQRVKGDTIYLDLGKNEGILPKKHQAPHENYQVGDRLKTIVEEVKQTQRGHIAVILSRTSPNFVKKLIEVEIPEIYDQTVEVFKIVREPGYRTKIAVFSGRDEIDPVGACVGHRGIRIQNIIKELEGEKIDVLKWTIDIKKFIENALIPAKVYDVVIVNDVEKKAVAVVDDSQLSFAVGRRGMNIRLANALTEWTIEVKTIESAKEEGIIADHMKEAEDLFRDNEVENDIDELELPTQIKDTLYKADIYSIEQIIEYSLDEIKAIDGMTEEMATYLKEYLDENFEVVEEEETEEYDEEGEYKEGVVVYECPNCGKDITEDQAACPSCGVELAFEEDEEEAEGETEADDEADDKAETEADDKAETEADDKAETEADDKAETEADDKAETEADDKAETEADDKADDETEKNEE